LHFKGKKDVWQATNDFKMFLIKKTLGLMRKLAKLVDFEQKNKNYWFQQILAKHFYPLKIFFLCRELTK
jgi:hypothetical protein